MRSGTLFLPFVAFFSGVLAVATGKAFQDIPLISLFLWLLAGGCLIVWFVLDRKEIAGMFKRKGARHGLSQGLSVLLALTLAVGIGMLTNRDRFNKSFDLTSDGLNTLAPETTKLIEQLRKNDQEVGIIAFFQDDNKKAQFTRLVSIYQTAGAKFSVEYIDPQADPTRAMAENITTPDTVLVKLGTQEARLTTFTEEKFSNAIVKTMKERERSVYFIKGHGEPDIDNKEGMGFSLAKAELESARFKVGEVNLIETGKIPDDADLVIIAGPQYDLLPAEKAMLDQAMRSGLPLMIMLDALRDLPEVKSLAESAGVRFNDDLLIITPEDPRAQLLGQNNAIVSELDSFSPITADFARRGGAVAFVTANTRSVELMNENTLGLKPVGLGRTNPIIIKVKDVRSEADLKGGVKASQIQNGTFDVFAVSTGQVGSDKLASNPTAANQDVSAEKTNPKKELRVFVSGTAQLASNLGAQRGENLDLFVNAINYLLQDEDFLSIQAKDSSPSRLDLTMASSQFLLLFLTFIYPFLFLGAGGYYWFQRRRA